jgi:hypothetical protein
MLANGRFKRRLICKIATAETCGNTDSKPGFNSGTKQAKLHEGCASVQMRVLVTALGQVVVPPVNYFLAGGTFVENMSRSSFQVPSMWRQITMYLP